jgi:hypothetical protein
VPARNVDLPAVTEPHGQEAALQREVAPAFALEPPK